MSPDLRRVAILGSTGSIGRQAVEVVRNNPDRLEIVALVAGRNERDLAAQAASLGVSRSGLGPEAALEAATLKEADVVLNAIVGAAGLRASVAALEAGKTLALANKESLVAGGPVCLAAARKGGGRIVPVDSEHAAIAQALEGRDPTTVGRIVLTASGGPFRARRDLADVTPAEALVHPRWSMGPKITIDSATMMNKGLEIIEAHHLFGLDYDRIDILVHPQSIVHGIVEFVDGSMLMQSAPTDMRIPIQAALLGPHRLPFADGRVDLAALGSLQFEAVDHDRFPAVRLAYRAGRQGRSYPAVLNAGNEVAVEAFLSGMVAFTGIPAIIEELLAEHEAADVSDVDAVLAVDRRARARAREKLQARSGVPR